MLFLTAVNECRPQCLSSHGSRSRNWRNLKNVPMAKKALTRNLNQKPEVEYVRELEEELLEKINRLGIGPGDWEAVEPL